MQTLPFQQNTGFNTGALIKRNQQTEADHDAIRSAVRAWAAAEGQDVVSAHIIDEWRQQGGEEIAFPDDISRAAIMAVLPLEFRHRLMPQDDILSRLSSAMKECAEAKQAVMLNAPEHQKLKEVSEGIASLFRLMPEQTGTLMTLVSSMLCTL